MVTNQIDNNSRTPTGAHLFAHASARATKAGRFGAANAIKISFVHRRDPSRSSIN